MTTKLELSGYSITEQLYSGSRTAVYRAVRLANAGEIPQTNCQSVVIKFLKRQHPTFSELVQFRNQFAIAKHLNLPGVIQPYCLEPCRNSYALVMQDFGGISLRQYSQEQPLPLERFFDVAVQITSILHQLHQQRIIHKDLKPANILIHPETGQIKLIDFSIASLLPRETQDVQNPNGLEGTLAYLSPEQTGRMNRGIDYRSDFYALGVTFFELLCGQLPFGSDDPMELLHCHIAKSPVSVCDLKPDLPLMLGEIIRKLMAKNAEDRYQSALGLKYDLELCWKQCQTTSKPTWFKLGQADVCDRFLIPEKLYGREAEVQALLEAFGRVANGAAELMLVAGFSGIGKTAVVNEVHKPIVRWNGYFIKGKYDQFQRNIPFSAFVQAFRDLIGQLLSETDAQLLNWKVKILEAVGDNGQVMIEVIPELEQIIGKQPPAPELSGSAAQNRFNLLFQKFIQVFATANHPLVLFIDDLQWADSASLTLMKLLMSESRTGYLLILGAYRNNEVFAAHPLMLTLEEIEKAEATLNIITLSALSRTNINQLVADTLSCTLELAKPLSELVYQKTQGNPFFTNQFLKVLHEDRLITFNPPLVLDHGQTSGWQCDITQIRSLALTDDVVEFMGLQLQKLPQATQEMLKLAACIGNQFDLTTLAIVSEKSLAEAASDLWKALQEGLILPQSEVYKFFGNGFGNGLEPSNTESVASPSVVYRFLHDRVQQAAYSLIPASQKKATHLKIGQLLLQNTAPEAIESSIFDIVNQLNEGVEIITQASEKYELAQLNLIAGKKAKVSTAYKAAVKYFTLGRKLLSEDSWQTDYLLTFELHRECAECEYLTGSFSQAERLFDIALNQTQDQFAQADIYGIQMYLKMTQGENIAAGLDAGLKGLSVMGMNLPVTVEAQQAAIEVELDALNRELASVQPADLFELPEMTDPVKKVCMSLLADLWAAAYMQGNPHLSRLVPLLMIKLSLQYGNAASSGFAYCLHGMSLSNQGNYATAYEFGTLALKLDRHFHSTQFIPKTHNIFAHTINPYNRHLKTNLALSQKSFEVCQETGNLVFGVWAVSFFIWATLIKGTFLPDVYAETEKYLSYVQQVNDVNMLYAFTLQRQFVLHLQGITKTTDLLDIQSDTPNDRNQQNNQNSQELAYIEVWRQKRNFEHGINWFCFLKLQLAYLYGRYEDAIAAAVEAEATLPANANFFPIIQYYFYYSLSLTALYPTVTVEQQNQYWQVLQQHQQTLKIWSENCPENFLHRYLLLSAEIAHIFGNPIEAIELYDRAIELAKANEYINEAAVANELAAQCCLAWGKARIAQVYLIEAYYGYTRWGANAKVADLEKHYSQLLSPILQQVLPSLSPTETIFAATATSTTSASNNSDASLALDLASILKVSQVLSGEIELEKLLCVLLQVVIENAGADRCILLLVEDNHLMVRAIAQTDGCTTLTTPHALESSSEVPISLINIVKRSLSPAVIVNAMTHAQLASDSYIQQHQPKSILCSPILQQGKLQGILYLENTLTTGAFTRDRVEVLNLLCAQAATSLENARLYQQAQTYAQQLEQSLSHLQSSETRFQNLAANLPGMIYQFRVAADGTGSILYISSGCFDLYEVPAEDFLTGVTDFRSMEHPDDRLSVDQAILHSVQTLAPFKQEWRIVTPSGTVKWVQSVARLEQQADGSVIWDGMMLDITERKHLEIDQKRTEAERQQVEIAMRLSEERYRCLANTTAHLVWITDADGQVVEDIPSWRAYTGQTFDEIKGIGILQALHPDDYDRTVQVWLNAVQTQSPYKVEYRVRSKDGIYRYFDVHGVPVLDADGSIREWIGACTDIDDRKRAEAELNQRTAELEQTLQELQRTQSQMVQAEKMSSLGQLVAGVAHEINNPVNFIFGNLTHANNYTTDILELLALYQTCYPSPDAEIQSKIEAIDLDFLLEDLPKILASMRIGADRIQKIVSSLRTFSRMDEAEMKAVDIHEGIDSTLMILQHRLKAKSDRPTIEIIKQYSNLPHVECYAGQLNQVFMNVLSNAIDALEDNTEIIPFVQIIKASPASTFTITIQTQLIEGHQVEIRIADNGPGMTETVRQRLFDPFFTTKPVGKGTGMGLSISYQIITEKHGGSLACVSAPGEGAEFIIRIPLWQNTNQNAIKKTLSIQE